MEARGFKLKKRARRCAGMDRISELPDEIITHILSFLPLEDAVATSILSSRWLSLWKYTPNLIFINDPYEEDPTDDRLIHWDIEDSLENVEWVNSVLNSYKALSLKQFTISFYVHPKAYHQVSEWLRFAFSRRVESLKLNFIQESPFVLDINTLRSIKSSDYRFLRELTLDNLQVSGEAIELFQRNCPRLEGLLMRATLTSDLVIGGSLKYLEIYASCSLGKSIKVSAPNLTRLLKCSYNYKKLLLENVPNLIEASFDIAGPEDTMHYFTDAAAKLEILTITLFYPKAFLVPKMPKLKKLVLDYGLVLKKWHRLPETRLPVTRLLRRSPNLEEFKLEVSDIFMYFYATQICKAIFKVPKDGGFEHKHLKVFEFSGFCDKAPDHIELVRYVVNGCVALKEIIITPLYPAVARQFLRRTDTSHRFLYQVDATEEEYTLNMKKSTEQLLAGKIPHHIKLTVI